MNSAIPVELNGRTERPRVPAHCGMRATFGMMMVKMRTQMTFMMMMTAMIMMMRMMITWTIMATIIRVALYIYFTHLCVWKLISALLSVKLGI